LANSGGRGRCVLQLTGLWQEPDFRKLWSGRSLSLLGSEFSLLGLPLVAALELGASPLQMGIIAASNGVPAIFCGLFFGAWVDRHRRIPLMILSDIGRAGFLLVIPVAFIFDWLSIGVMVAVALGMGTMAILFEIAHGAVLPTEVSREQLKLTANLSWPAPEHSPWVPASGAGWYRSSARRSRWVSESLRLHFRRSQYAP
jgi:MFS family permease